MNTDKKGCANLPLGAEQFEMFTATVGMKKYKRVQYDYRHFDGRLFTCVAKTLDDARQKRTEWIWQKEAAGQ